MHNLFDDFCIHLRFVSFNEIQNNLFCISFNSAFNALSICIINLLQIIIKKIESNRIFRIDFRIIYFNLIRCFESNILIRNDFRFYFFASIRHRVEISTRRDQFIRRQYVSKHQRIRTRHRKKIISIKKFELNEKYDLNIEFYD